MPARRGVVRPGLHDRRRGAWRRRGPTSRARRRPGRAPAARRAAGSCPPRRGSSRPPRRARASCAWGGPRTRAPARAARRCRRRCRGRRAPRRRRGRPRSRSGAGSGPRAGPITFTSSPAGVAEALQLGTGKPRASNWPRTQQRRAPVARRCRRAGRARATAMSTAPAAARRPSNSTSAARPWGSGRGPALQREHRQHHRQQRGHERRPVDARLDHLDEGRHRLNLQFRRWRPPHPGSCSSTTSCRFRSCSPTRCARRATTWCPRSTAARRSSACARTTSTSWCST